MDFSKFDKEVDLEGLKSDVEEAKENGDQFSETPAGTYVCKLENLELGETKDGRPMLKGMFRVIEGDQKKRCLFMNRVLYGTKNDANMIASAIGWLDSLDSGLVVTFDSYKQFSELVLDVFEAVADLEYEVEYDPNAFNSISISDIFE